MLFHILNIIDFSLVHLEHPSLQICWFIYSTKSNNLFYGSICRTISIGHLVEPPQFKYT